MSSNIIKRVRARRVLHIVGTSAAAVAAGLTTPAMAQCAPDPTVAGGTTTCSGTDSDGIAITTNTSTLAVQSGATVTNSGAAAISMAIASGASDPFRTTTITVDGTVDGGGSAGIAVTNGTSVSSSYGQVGTTATILVGSGGSVTGANAITAAPSAGNTFGASLVVLDNSGTISGSAGPALTSTGTYAGFSTITNRAGGLITGISAPAGMITNAGTVDGGSGSAIYGSIFSVSVFPNGITNSGTIDSNGASATVSDYTSRITNTGTIAQSGAGSAIAGSFATISNGTGGLITAATGDTVSVTGQLNLDNSGTISNTGSGIALRGGGISLNNSAGGTIAASGTAVSASNVLSLTNRGTITGKILAGSASSMYSSSTVDSIGGTIVGDVTFGANNDYLFATYSPGVGLSTGVTGTIDGGAGKDTVNVQFAADATLSSGIAMPANFETLALAPDAGVTVTLAQGFVSPSNGIALSGSGTLVNATALSADGSVVSGGSFGSYPGSFTNSGSITSTGSSGAYAVGLQPLSAFVNGGTIVSSGGGVNVSPNSFDNSGTITAAGTAVNAFVSGPAFSNSGTIRSTGGTGLILFGSYYGGDLAPTNTGTIEGSAVGVSLITTLVNKGVISSAGTAVQLQSSSVLDNRAGGVVTGSTAAIAPAASNMIFNSVVLNAGTINGDVSFASPYPSYYANNNRYIALAGGVLNGNLTLGQGDMLVTEIDNTGTGQFAGISGTVSASGSNLHYEVRVDTSATAALPSGFVSVGYDLYDNAALTLGGTDVLDRPLSFSGTGSVDLNADIAVNDQPAIQSTGLLIGSGYSSTPNALSITSSGTITLNRTDANRYPGAAIWLGSNDSFVNTGSITVNDTSAATYGTLAAIVGGTITNSGTITVTKGEGIMGMQALTNSGTITSSGAAADFVSGSGEIINTGTLASTGGPAIVAMYGGSSVENASGGAISGGFGVAVQLGGGTVLNAGTISGDVDLGYSIYGRSYNPGIYAAAGGTVSGDVRFGSGSDLFLADGDSTGVSGVVDGGDGDDTFGRIYRSDATVDLGNPLGGLNFELEAIHARGTDTTVTLTAATPYAPSLWIGGDGKILSQATIEGSVNGSLPYLGYDVPASFGLDLTLAEFRNEGTILGGFDGKAASFVNTGQIGDGDGYEDGVNLFVADSQHFDNSGTITGAPGENAVEISSNSAVDVNAANSGTINGGFSVELSAPDSSRNASIAFSNTGSILTTEEETGGFYADLETAGGTVTVDNSGTINASGVESVALTLSLSPADDAQTHYAITNSGTIEANGGGATHTYQWWPYGQTFTSTAPAAAIEVFGNERVTGTIVNTATGTISATGPLSMAVATWGGALDLTNAGTISGTAGQMLAAADGLAVASGSQFLAGAVKTLGDTADVIRNSGTITGSIDLGAGDDRIENSGLLQGNTYLGLGDDTLKLVAGGVIDGIVDGSDGTDAILVDATGDGSVKADTLTGFESLTQTGTGTIAYSGTFGVDTINLAGSNLKVDEGATLATSGTTTITGTSASENVTVAGTLTGAIALGDGDDRFTEIGAGRATGPVDGGAGHDTYALVLNGDRAGLSAVSNFEELAVGGSGSLTLDRSFELVTLSGANLIVGTGAGAGSIIGSGAAEQVTSAGDLPAVSLGGGDDTLSLGAAVLGGTYLGGEGSDTFNLTSGEPVVLNGTVSGFEHVVSASGALSVAGTLGAAGETVSLGDGGQTLTLLAGGRLLGTVDLGDGDDVVRLNSATVGTVQGGSGNDTVNVTVAGDTSLAGTFTGFERLLSEGNGILSLSGGASQFDRVDSATDLTIAADASLVAPQVVFGARDDKMVIAGGFVGSITGGAGNDTITVPGGTAANPVRFASISEIEAFSMTGGFATLSGQAQLGDVNLTGGRFVGLAGSAISASNITVGAGATFGTAGTVNAGLSFGSGAVFSPGASPAVMTVNGNVSLANGSSTVFEFVPAPGQSDQLLINGNLTIASGAVLNLTGNRPLTPGVAYDMIVANSISGQFTIGTWDRTAVQGSLRYVDGAGQDKLQLLGTFVSPSPLPGGAGAAVTYVNNLLVSGGASTALLNSVPALLDSNGYANAQAFAMLNPEPYASAMQLGTEHGLTLARVDRSGLMNGSGDAPTLFGFGAASGNWRTLAPTLATGANGAKNHVYDGLGGIGFGSAHASVAAFVGYMDGQQQIAALGASTDSDGMLAGASAHLSLGGLNLGALAGYYWGKAHTTRAVPGGATASSQYDLNSFVLDGSASYDMPVGASLVVTPSVGLTRVSTVRDATRESGSAAFALDVDRDSHAATFVDGGLALRTAAVSSLRPWGEVGLRHQLSGDTPYASAGLSGSTTRFAVPGVSRDRTVVTYAAGFEAAVAPNVDFSLSYHGESGGGTGSNVSGGLRIQF